MCKYGHIRNLGIKTGMHGPCWTQIEHLPHILEQSHCNVGAVPVPAACGLRACVYVVKKLFPLCCCTGSWAVSYKSTVGRSS